MKRKLKNRYEGFGFAESLIAIVITGIAATVLMTISANSMSRLMQIEDMDKMAQLARSGAITAQQIADTEFELEEDARVYYNAVKDSCYVFNSDTFSLDDTVFLTNETFKIDAKFPEDPEGETQPYEDFFRVICIEGKTDTNIAVKIVTGLVNVEGRITNSSDTKDYEYFAIIDL